MAAFRAPFSETQATGTPGGICTIERMASRPPAAVFDDVIGTPMTGNSVYAATAPGSAADIPAPAMITRTPRSAAVEAYSATPRGSRWADRTRNSLEMPRSFSSSTAGSIPSRSDSEPMRMPTSGPASSNSSSAAKGTSCRWDSAWDMYRPPSHIGSVVHARKVDLLDRGVSLLACLRDGVPRADHVQHAPSGRDELAVSERGARVKDEGAGCAGHLDPADGDPALRVVRIAACGQNDRDRGERPGPELDSGQVAVCRGGEPLEEVSLDARQERLGLRVAEAAVELEHARAGLGEHQARVEEPGEGRAAAGELGDHRAVDEVGEFLDVVLVEQRDRRIAAHAAGVRALVAVQEPLEVLRGRERHGSLAVAEGEERDLLAVEQFFDDHVAAERAGAVQRGIGLLLRAANEDALPRGEAVRLDDARRAGFVERRSGRDLGCREHLLGERLRPFDSRGRLARAEHRHACASELVGHAGDERRLRPDDDEIDLVQPGEAEQAFDVVHPDGVAAPERSDAGIPRGCVQLGEPR